MIESSLLSFRQPFNTESLHDEVIKTVEDIISEKTTLKETTMQVSFVGSKSFHQNIKLKILFFVLPIDLPNLESVKTPSNI